MANKLKQKNKRKLNKKPNLIRSATIRISKGKTLTPRQMYLLGQDGVNNIKKAREELIAQLAASEAKLKDSENKKELEVVN